MCPAFILRNLERPVVEKAKFERQCLKNQKKVVPNFENLRAND